MSKETALFLLGFVCALFAVGAGFAAGYLAPPAMPVVEGKRPPSGAELGAFFLTASTVFALTFLPGTWLLAWVEKWGLR